MISARKNIPTETNVSIYDLEGDLIDVQDFIHQLFLAHGGDATMSFRADDDGEIECMIYGHRPETDAELNARLERARKAAERKANKPPKPKPSKEEERERDELRRLAKKYGMMIVHAGGWPRSMA